MNLDEKELERRSIAKEKILAGEIGAISIDTNIFKASGYLLENGNFKQLEKFKGNHFCLVFSDVVLSEVLKHLTEASEDAKSKLASALRTANKCWKFDISREQEILDELMSARTSSEIAKERIKDFKNRTGYQVVDSKSNLDIQKLLNRYFLTDSPFESSKDKKSEFPDAIALISLDNWSKQEDKGILVVTQDKGWHSFCAEDNKLFSINDLGEALVLVQARDTLSQDICSKIGRLISNGAYPDLLSFIQAKISSDVWAISWEPDASSYYYYDCELQSVDVTSVEFERGQSVVELQALDYRGSEIVARARVIVEIEAECEFYFEMKDGIDGDMVSMGSAVSTQQDSVEIEIILTFENLESEKPDFVELELIPSRCYIDFGYVEPDYGEQDD
jgi:PIN domain